MAESDTSQNRVILDDTAIAEALGRMLDVPFKRGGADVQKKHNWTVLYHIAEVIPDEFKYDDGKLTTLDIRPYIEIVLNDPKTPDDEKDNLELISNQAELYVNETLPSIQEETRQQEREVTGLQPSADGSFLIDPFYAEDMSAQEFAQTYGSTSLLDLADKELSFGLAGLMSGGKVGDDNSASVYEAVRWFYDLSSEQVGELQQDLARAGYFDQVGQSYAQVGDASDAATRQAWDLFLVDVVRQGAEATPKKVMDQRIQTYMQNRRPVEGYVFSDQATLRSLGNEFAQAFAGRNLDYVELQTFFQMAREWERQAALGVTFAQENERVDVRARAEEYFDSELRVEQAKNIGSKWGDFGQGQS